MPHGDDVKPWLVDVADATATPLCGGKAAGLAKLARGGFHVPAAICATTALYRRWLERTGIVEDVAVCIRDAATAGADARRDALAKLHVRVATAAMPDDLAAALHDAVGRLRDDGSGPIAVRSSAPWEDEADASHAGIHESFVVDGDVDAVIAAVKACWASLWTPSAWAYRERLHIPHAAVAMAVVLQRFIAADRAGVAFSADPMAGDRDTVVIEAAWGTGAAVVSGRVTPDEYRVALGAGGSPRVERRPGRQDEITVWRGGEQMSEPIPEAWRATPVLSDAEALELARLVKAVERTLGTAADVEWTFDGATFWTIQARPITTLAAAPAETLWTRANLKEVFPEQPSPLALSYLDVVMNRMFRSYHSGQGYTLPADARLVSVFHGRPYLNLSLMNAMTEARGGDPAIVVRLFGGAAAPARAAAPAAPADSGMRARARLARELATTFFRTPGRGRRLFRRIERQGRALRTVPLARLDDRALLAHLQAFSATMIDDAMLRRLHEVVSAQSRAYMVLERLLDAWIGDGAEGLVQRMMTGLGTLPNARMTYRLMALGALAAGEPRARAFFDGPLDAEAVRGHRAALAGTRFLAALDAFLAEFGHRGPYESDVMSSRFEEDPAPIFRLVRLYMRAGAAYDPERHAAERRALRRTARAETRRALRQGKGRLAFGARWLAFSLVCDVLERLLALRDECRHVTTLLAAHLRRLVLEIGARAVRDGHLAAAADVFFLTWDEVPRVLTEREHDWRPVVLERRHRRAEDARVAVPDLRRGEALPEAAPGEAGAGELTGLGVSPGRVTGVVRVLRSLDDVSHLSGEIVVFPSIEPSLTPIFPLVRGVVTEMGGLLSHAAILAREYGLPAVVNVAGATERLHDGDRIELDGATGRIRVLERRPG
jgi:pyruvate,water dikinase